MIKNLVILSKEKKFRFIFSLEIENWLKENIDQKFLKFTSSKEIDLTQLEFKDEDYNLFKLVFGHKYEIMTREEYLTSGIFF